MRGLESREPAAPSRRRRTAPCCSSRTPGRPEAVEVATRGGEAADGLRHRRPAARGRGRPSCRSRIRRSEVVAADPTPRPRLRDRRGHRRRRHDPARPPSSARADRHAAARHQPRPRRLPRRGRVGRPRQHGRGDHRRHATSSRSGRPSTYACSCDGARDQPRLGAQRGQCREGHPPADARGARRDRRPPAVPVGLRRRGVRDADGFDGVRVQRGWPGRLARGRGAAARADQRARPVRPADGGLARLHARASTCSRRARTAACCGATAVVRSTCLRAPGSRYAAGERPVRLARLHEAPFTDRLVAKFDLPVSRLARAERPPGDRREAGTCRCLRSSRSAPSA